MEAKESSTEQMLNVLYEKALNDENYEFARILHEQGGRSSEQLLAIKLQVAIEEMDDAAVNEIIGPVGPNANSIQAFKALNHVLDNKFKDREDAVRKFLIERVMTIAHGMTIHCPSVEQNFIDGYDDNLERQTYKTEYRLPHRDEKDDEMLITCMKTITTFARDKCEFEQLQHLTQTLRDMSEEHGMKHCSNCHILMVKIDPNLT